MRKFVFSMQTLYDVKKASEKQALADFAAARDRLQQLEEKARACRDVIGREQSHLDDRARSGIPTVDFQNACAYLKGLRQEALALDAEIQRAQTAVTEKQQALRKIHQDKKALEHLRDTQYRDHLAEQNVREAKETEDLLMSRMLEKLERRNDPA